MTARRIGILTGGGDCAGLNAVIRAVVHVAHAEHSMQVLGIEDAFHGLVHEQRRAPHGNRWLGRADVDELLSRGGTVLGTSNRCDPFEYIQPHLPDQAPQDVSSAIVARVKELGLEGLISLGGDGSMRIAAKLHALGLPIIGVPKTIDNDIASTDQTFGFDTALHVVTDALDRLRDTAASHDRVMILEVMGRDAGWLALHGAIAGGADLVLLPELPYDIDAVAREILQRQQGGRTHAVVVVSEGAYARDGRAHTSEHLSGAMPRLAGAASALEQGLRARLSQEMRVTVLGHVQRGGSPSPFDRVLATRYGRAAAELAARGEYGKMVALRKGEIISVDLADAASGQKHVGPDDPLVATARAMGIGMGQPSISS